MGESETMQDNSKLSVLIIDPNPGMRGNLQNMLAQANITKVEFAVNSGTAIRQLSKRSYDIILCEYDLGSGAEQGQDGQQLLEDLRHHKLIGMWTIFIMLTSEGVYSKVISAAELTPTDYILKPFTVDVLSQRIARAIERRTVFLPTYQLIGQGKTREAIRSCIDAENAHPRHATDFVRLRAELHASLHEYPEAEHLYNAMLGAKPVGWASLGLARTLFAQDRIDEAEAVLTALVAVNPKLMAAYDLLARCHAAQGAPARAQQVLEEAVSISPHIVRRLRHLGETALEAGDVAVAEKSFKQVVTKAKYSEFRDPEDHVNLVTALVRKGDATQASGVIRDLERSMRGSPNADVCKAISIAMLHDAAGNLDAAAKELANAAGAVRTATGLSDGLKISLAQSCIKHKLDQEASEVMLSVVSDTKSAVSTEQAMGVFVKAGRPDLADGMGAQLKAQAQILLGVANEKTQMRDFKGAVQTLQEALNLAPGSVPVALALCRGILNQLDEHGWEHGLAEVCKAQIETIQKIDAAHPQLEHLVDRYNAMKRKYGIAAS
jgi:DNA-binding NarL/FixJ family response regulator/Tfp pilus assembly protein PilF